MVDRNEGLTRPTIDSTRAAKCSRRRPLARTAAEMDAAVLRAYSWDELADRAAPEFIEQDADEGKTPKTRLDWPAEFKTKSSPASSPSTPNAPPLNARPGLWSRPMTKKRTRTREAHRAYRSLFLRYRQRISGQSGPAACQDACPREHREQTRRRKCRATCPCGYCRFYGEFSPSLSLARPSRPG